MPTTKASHSGQNRRRDSVIRRHPRASDVATATPASSGAISTERSCHASPTAQATRHAPRLTHDEPTPRRWRTRKSVATRAISTCGQSPIEALHHSVVARVSGAHMSSARSGTRAQLSGSSRLRRCQATTPEASCTARIIRLIVGQSNGRWWATSQYVACCRGITCPATGSIR